MLRPNALYKPKHTKAIPSTRLLRLVKNPVLFVDTVYHIIVDSSSTKVAYVWRVL